MKEQSNPFEVFIVEDDDDDRLFLAFDFLGSGLEKSVHFFSDIDELICFQNNQEDYSVPTSILLNAFMQKIDIRQAVELIKSVDELQSVPLVVMVGTRREKEYLRSYNLNVSGYVTKPVNSKIIKRFLKIR